MTVVWSDSIFQTCPQLELLSLHGFKNFKTFQKRLPITKNNWRCQRRPTHLWKARRTSPMTVLSLVFLAGPWNHMAIIPEGNVFARFFPLSNLQCANDKSNKPVGHSSLLRMNIGIFVFPSTWASPAIVSAWIHAHISCFWMSRVHHRMTLTFFSSCGSWTMLNQCDHLTCALWCWRKKAVWTCVWKQPKGSQIQTSKKRNGKPRLGWSFLLIATPLQQIAT